MMSTSQITFLALYKYIVLVFPNIRIMLYQYTHMPASLFQILNLHFPIYALQLEV